MIYRMMPFTTTVNDPILDYKSMALFDV